MRLFINFSFILLLSIWLTACTNNDYSSIIEEGSLAITVNIKDMTVSFINLDSQEKIDDWKMKKPYTGGLLLPDGDSLLLYGKQVETADIFSLSQGKEVDSWDIGKGVANAKLLNYGDEIVFADQAQNAVRFFTINGEEIGKVRTGRNPLTLLEGEEQDKLYVVSFNDEQLTVIDMRSKEKSFQFTIHPSATGAILREEQNELWIGGHGVGVDIESDIHVYDTENGKPKRDISAPIMPINFVEEDDYIFVLSHGSSTLYKLDGEGKTIKTLKVGANPFDLSIITDQMVVAGYDSNDIHVINTQTLEIQKTIKVGKGPFQIIIRER
ncbi:YncE family protein [Cytobacillus sp. FJAT-54145]|uniref:YncE family protein n=1 Tax=Cytobacillus spartinae TaxID=3299023 RepID=A0ABW6KGS7_9BACI